MSNIQYLRYINSELFQQNTYESVFRLDLQGFFNKMLH